MPARSAFALAALASAAVPGMEPVQVHPHETNTDDVDTAAIEDSLQRRWVVRAPRSAAAGVRLDAEAQLVEGLMSWLPFALPQLEGSAPLPGGGRAVVHRQLAGHRLRAIELTHQPALADALGRAIAAVHNLPGRLVEEAGLPVYDAEEHRHRRLAELDRAAATGMVPQGLLQRWEWAVEQVGAWRFLPCVVHGDLVGDNVLTRADQVTGMIGWSQARVGDPADDLAWLAIGEAEPALAAVLAGYTAARSEPPDPALVRRARLAAEFAIARWLLHGVSTGDAKIVADAVQMLSDLEAGVGDASW